MSRMFDTDKEYVYDKVSPPTHLLRFDWYLPHQAWLKERGLLHHKCDGVEPQQAELIDLDFSGCNLGQARLASAILSGCNFTLANLSRAQLSNVYAVGATFTRANLSYAQLASADLSSANLVAADLHSAKFYAASLRRADLSCARVYKTDFSCVDLEKATLHGVAVCAACFKDAYVKDVVFDGDYFAKRANADHWFRKPQAKFCDYLQPMTFSDLEFADNAGDALLYRVHDINQKSEDYVRRLFE